MRTTLTVDDKLFEKAMSLATPGTSTADLLKQCIEAFIQRQTSRRLAAWGGRAPDIALAPRRRETTVTAPRRREKAGVR